MARSSRTVGESALLLSAFAAMSVGLVMPREWVWLLAAMAAVTTVGAGLRYGRQTMRLPLFCAIALLTFALNPWLFWPMPLLVPLAVYVIVVGVVPGFRRGAVGGLLGASRSEGEMGSRLQAVPTGWVDWWTGALMGVTVLGSSIALVIWYHLAQPDVSDIRRQIPPWSPAWLVLVGAGFSVVNALIEETIWRGILWELLSRAVPVAGVVVVLQAGSFGLAHLGGFPRGWAGVGLAALYGLFMGLIRQRAGGLGLPIITHFFADVTIFAILVLTIAR
jgi:membrane protease YdiL (CAAX protease family)